MIVLSVSIYINRTFKNNCKICNINIKLFGFMPFNNDKSDLSIILSLNIFNNSLYSVPSSGLPILV